MGTGGCGSGFIWHMLKNCGLDTGEMREWVRQGGIRNSKDPANFPAPKVIKHLGGFLTNLALHLDTYKWEVEHIFFTISTLDLALNIQKSRMRKRKKEFNYDEQLALYYEKLGKGLSQLIDLDCPFTIIRCPTSILEPRYCYDKLKVVLPDTTYEEFAKQHAAFIIPKKRDRLYVY